MRQILNKKALSLFLLGQLSMPFSDENLAIFAFAIFDISRNTKVFHFPTISQNKKHGKIHTKYIKVLCLLLAMRIGLGVRIRVKILLFPTSCPINFVYYSLHSVIVIEAYKHYCVRTFRH